MQNKKFTYLCNISRKALGVRGEVDFLPGHQHESFVQSDSVTLGLHSQACPKYLKQQVYNMFVIFQGKREGWTRSFPTDKRQKFLEIAIIIFGLCAQACQITQNNKSAVSLQYLRKELGDEVDFLHADKHENLLQVDSMISMGMVKHFQSSQNSNFFTISRKRS